MTTTEATMMQSPPPWSLAAPARATGTDGHPARSTRGQGVAIGRPEDLDERRQFSAALRSADRNQYQAHQYQAGSGAGQTRSAAAAPTANNPEDRWMVERAQYNNDDTAPDQAVAEGEAFFGEDGLSFGDVIDIINPLQHLPVVSTLYRSLTGDEISPGARIAGGTLYGGPIGFASALANTVSEDVSGQDIGERVMAALFGDEDVGETGITVASADAAADVAQIAPAAGASPQAIQSAMVQPQQPQSPAHTQPQNKALFQNIDATPLFTGRGTGNLLAAGPLATGEGVSQTQALAPVSTPVSAPVSAPAPTAMAAAAQGVPNLSPQAANILMQMAQQSQGAAMQNHTAEVQARSQSPAMAPVTPPAIAPPPTPPAPPSPPIAAAPSAVPPSTPTASTASSAEPSTASATASVAERAQTAAYIEPIPAQDLPSAMMEALSKYESMKGGG